MVKTHDLTKPSKSYNRNKTNIKAIVPKWIKPQIINPHSHNTHTKHTQPFKTPIYNV